jgi:hypothetical protein
MQLVLRVPEGWRRRDLENGRALIRLPNDLEIELDAFVAAPDEPRLWMEQTMLRDAPFASKLKEPMPVLARNELGWPMEITAATVVDPAGAVIEARLGAFYKFQEWAASALVRAKDPAELDAVRGALIEAFQTGRPEWKNPNILAAIHELWE